MKRKGMSLISLLIAVVSICGMMLFFFYGLPGIMKSSTSMGGAELKRQPGEAIPEAAMNQARGVQCMSNLRNVRLALQMFRDSNDGQLPASLSELSTQGVTLDILSCPVSHQPYSYDPASPKKVFCTTPGHESY